MGKRDGEEKDTLSLPKKVGIGFIGLFVAVGALSSGGDGASPQPAPQEQLAAPASSAPESSVAAEQSDEAPIPESLAMVGTTDEVATEEPETLVISESLYTAEETDRIPGTKRSIDVVLDQKLTVEELEALGNTLRDADSESFDRTFIGYYLDGGTRSSYWATTHFTPELEVKVQGLPIEAGIDTSNDPSAFGVWIVEQEWFPGRYALTADGDGAFTMEVTHPDGSIGATSYDHTVTPEGDVFVENGSTTGDYLLVDNEGYLNRADDDGIWATSAPAS